MSDPVFFVSHKYPSCTFGHADVRVVVLAGGVVSQSLQFFYIEQLEGGHVAEEGLGVLQIMGKLLPGEDGSE